MLRRRCACWVSAQASGRATAAATVDDMREFIDGVVTGHIRRNVITQEIRTWAVAVVYSAVWREAKPRHGTALC